MTVEELKNIAEKTLQRALKSLIANGEFMQEFQLFHSDGTVTLMAVDPSVTNSGPDKDALSERIREMIAHQNVVAVVMASDTFWGTANEATMKLIRKLGFNVQQAAAAGLCEVREALYVSLESPLYEMTIRQHYKRDASNDRRIILCEREDWDDTVPNSGHSGRFAGYFAHQRESHAPA